MGDLSNEFEKLDLSGYFRMAHCHGGEIKRGADGKQLITGEWKKTQKLLAETSDRECVQTLKHDGTQCVYDLRNGKTRIASHNPSKQSSDGFLNTHPDGEVVRKCIKQFHNGLVAEEYPRQTQSKIEALYETLECERLIVRGEYFGKRDGY